MALLPLNYPALPREPSGGIDAGATAEALNKLLIDILQWL